MPKMSDKDIAALIASGDLGSVCIDTSIAHRTGYNLESGSLVALGQFARGPISLLIPDIIAGEIKGHMLTNAQSAVVATRGALRELRKTRRHSAKAIENVETGLGLSDDLRAEIDKRWDDFVQLTAADVLSASDWLDGGELVKSYLEKRPPFEAGGKKKAEFPDSIALLQLEARGAKDSRFVLAISADDGWAAFAESAKWVIVRTELAPALGLFHSEDNYVVGRAISMLGDPNAFALSIEVDDALVRFLDEMNPEITAHAYLFFEEEFIEAEYQGHHPVEEYLVTIIDSDEASVTLAFPITIKARVSANFAFAVHDSIDRDYVPMGSVEATRDLDIEVDVVLKVARDSGPEDNSLSLKIDAPRFVPLDFGEVEPDFGPYDDE